MGDSFFLFSNILHFWVVSVTVGSRNKGLFRGREWGVALGAAHERHAGAAGRRRCTPEVLP